MLGKLIHIILVHNSVQNATEHISDPESIPSRIYRVPTREEVQEEQANMHELKNWRSCGKVKLHHGGGRGRDYLGVEAVRLQQQRTRHFWF